ncbi:right-handed parallel beta-helix repeat-containing protein [Agrilutibacter solisilvae]|uniref:Right-handed parallel beta-helix repeat-containing protein n=1 Tax=Agrilutibacter solisilvae TaxID=2763317 RepID=A0A975ASX4_9GAMM|nr:right-handed parallel beta-helix repeat-containing protein [Lysobacter solisilvae]QSX79222.1 right-handed parallel beta-helix repeat-containing protein [Lysobacter solisilvae]
MLRLTAILLLAALSALAAPAARAAQGYDNCTGFIDALPATISTPGTWCLRGHKYTSITGGHALMIDGDNVTIDCNHFRLSGLGAGATSNAFGITVNAGRSGAVIRRCRVQGFNTGMLVLGEGGRVEDNAIDMSLVTGLQVSTGGDNLIRRNIITDTGGYIGAAFAYGIYADSGVGNQFVDNTIRGIEAAGTADGVRGGPADVGGRGGSRQPHQRPGARRHLRRQRHRLHGRGGTRQRRHAERADAGLRHHRQPDPVPGQHEPGLRGRHRQLHPWPERTRASRSLRASRGRGITPAAGRDASVVGRATPAPPRMRRHDVWTWISPSAPASLGGTGPARAGRAALGHHPVSPLRSFPCACTPSFCSFSRPPGRRLRSRPRVNIWRPPAGKVRTTASTIRRW